MIPSTSMDVLLAVEVLTSVRITRLNYEFSSTKSLHRSTEPAGQVACRISRMPLGKPRREERSKSGQRLEVGGSPEESGGPLWQGQSAEDRGCDARCPGCDLVKPVVYYCEADVELVAAAKRYQCQREVLGNQFLRAVHLTLGQISEDPDRLAFYDEPARSG